MSLWLGVVCSNLYCVSCALLVLIPAISCSHQVNISTVHLDTTEINIANDDQVEVFDEKFISRNQSARLLTSLGIGEGSRRQDVFPQSHKFPCHVKNGTSRIPPTSVHRLRPGDINVVAAMGDSLVSGIGALAESLPELFTRNEGVSWSIGGDGSWRDVLTVPNLLREFNPRLVGFAESNHPKRRHFCMGEPMTHDEHLLGQARRLVALMRSDPRVDFKRHWKLITVLSGQNDICSGRPCFPSEEQAAREHATSLKRALDYLHANLPRTFISLLSVIDVTAGWRIEKSLVCGVINVIECRCLYLFGSREDVVRMKRIVDAFHTAEQQLVASGRYDTREDFTVELQPFTSKLLPPRARNFLGFELADLSLFSVDCFHLSQKGHAAFATMQWNNLFEPERNKSQHFLKPMQSIVCPTEMVPYLFTRKNSRNFLRTGRQ